MSNSSGNFDPTLCSGAYQFTDGGGTTAHGTVVFHIPQQPVKGRATTDEAKRQIIERLYTLWTKFPDLRLGQLIANFIQGLIYCEDEDLINTLEHGYVGVRMNDTEKSDLLANHAPASAHYKTMGIEPLQYAEANGLGVHEFNIVKYVSRWRQKGGLEDLKKAEFYIRRLIELNESVGSE